jgi:hypothetical protein
MANIGARPFAGTPDESTSTKNLAIKFARQPDQAATFNYASMAHNNHFFFKCLVREEAGVAFFLELTH